ncbi:hypothetical protein DVH24_018549 [Malus domestica]|uniref:Pre-mRNA-splicing factor SLU7 n=1 Tax=Malus domestica TaxID=3750 RepID=A0A498HLM5_MALDO|nr:hypothetical protein DVH24_018549 [Malus domestica]
MLRFYRKKMDGTQRLAAFKSREDHRKQMELEEARKAGLAPAEVDEDGKEINPHIPQYMSYAPWYLKANQRSLKHQRKWKSDPNYTKSWYDRGAKTFQADKYRNGASVGRSRIPQSCAWRGLEKKGARWTNMHIAPDEKIESFELDYDGKRDRWNGFDAATYAHIIERYEARDEARRKYLKEQQIKKLEEKNNKQNGEGEISEDDDDDDALKVDEAKVDESKQMDFARVEKRVRTTGGGSTGTVRHGDNKYRVSGQALEFKQLNIHAWEALEKGQDIHMQAAPSQAELLYKNFKVIKEKLKSQMKDAIMKKYGNAATEELLPNELLLGQSENKVEYDRAGRVVRGMETSLPKSKYEEDVYINNHTSVWGSWWKDHQWGYKCCKQTIRNSYCTGVARVKAAVAAADLMNANIARKVASEEKPAPTEEKRVATWGTDIPDDLEDERKTEEKDERKRKYNVKWDDKVTPEEREAYRMKKIHHDDPMKDFLH